MKLRGTPHSNSQQGTIIARTDAATMRNGELTASAPQTYGKRRFAGGLLIKLAVVPTFMGAAVGALSSASCSSSSTPSDAVSFVFEPAADVNTLDGFYKRPYPANDRLNAAGAPDLRNFPMRTTAKNLLSGVLKVAQERPGFPTTAISYFQFSGAVSPHLPEDTIAAAVDSPVFMIDVTDGSPDRGQLLPTVATQIEADEDDQYVPPYLLAVSARPGFVLKPKHSYAVVVRTSFDDSKGRALSVNPTFAKMWTQTSAAAGAAPGTGPSGPSYATVAGLLQEKGVKLTDIAAANIFTTGDVVEDTFALSERVKAAYSVTVTDIKVDPDDGASHQGYCELVGNVLFPQFQAGPPPFNTDGLFELDANGVPKKQRDESSPVTIAIPNGTIPAKGLPLIMYFHGSGGQGNEVVDASRSTVVDQDGPKGEGPAWNMAPRGFAMAASSLPFSIDRFPNASEQEYLNFNNLAAMRDTFRQGMLEQRLLIEALRTIRIPKSALGACSGVTLEAGATDFGFEESGLYAMGQSMGGAYTNYISALEPRIKGAVPTGAGGYWTYFVLTTSLIPNASGALALLLGVTGKLTFLHPSLSLVETAWEAVDPMVYVPRIARRPLPNHPPKPVYEAVGKGDRYFPIATYDYMALAYGHQQAGTEVWPSMQTALALEGKSGLLPYPIEGNLTTDSGEKTTGVVVQYDGDGIANAHAIYRQLDAVKYQYGCFLSTLHSGGTGKVFAPKERTAACE